MASLITSLISGGLVDSIGKLITIVKGKSPIDAEALSELAAKYQSDILQADVASRQAQADINKVEAGNSNFFIAGWRPAVGWVCGAGLGVQFLIAPLATWVAALNGKTIMFPTLDMGTLMTLLFGLLGLGTLRSYEKVNGVSAGH